MVIEFVAAATCREVYELAVPPADEARVKAMTDDELTAYVDENTSEWDFLRVSDSQIDGGAEDCEVLP